MAIAATGSLPPQQRSHRKESKSPQKPRNSPCTGRTWPTPGYRRRGNVPSTGTRWSKRRKRLVLQTEYGWRLCIFAFEFDPWFLLLRGMATFRPRRWSSCRWLWELCLLAPGITGRGGFETFGNCRRRGDRSGRGRTRARICTRWSRRLFYNPTGALGTALAAGCKVGERRDERWWLFWRGPATSE